MKVRARTVAVVLLLAAMAALSLAGLGNRFMWVDESITAVLGRNVLRFGHPRAWDGLNLVTSTNGNDFNQSLVFIKDNWLQYYLAAFAQLFSPSTFSLRLPFVLVGLAGAGAFYPLARRLAGGGRAALLALGLYSLSVPVMLYVRQVRYYSPGLLFLILTTLGYVEWTRRPDRARWAWLTASAVLLFHSMYMFFFVTMATVCSSYLLFDRRRGNLRGFALALAAIAAGTLPWFLYSRAFTGGVEATPFPGLGYFRLQVIGYIWQVHAYFFPFITLGAVWLFLRASARPRPGRGPAGDAARGPDGIPLWAAARDAAVVDDGRLAGLEARRRRLAVWRDLWLLLGQTAFTVVTISLFSNYFNTRFLLPAIPALYVLTARSAAAVGRLDRLAGAVAVGLLLSTNALGVAPYLGVKYSGIDPARFEALVKPPVPFFRAGWNWPFAYSLGDYLSQGNLVRSYPLEYLGEVGADYDDANEGMVRFLWTYADPGDTVFVYGPDYETVIYYTGLPVVDRLDPEWKPWPLVYRDFPNARRFQQLTRYPLRWADWVITRPIYYSEDEKRRGFPWESDAFERITVEYPDAPATPEIWYHSFRTDRSYPGFEVYRNRLTTRPIGKTTVGRAELEPGNGGRGGGS